MRECTLCGTTKEEGDFYGRQYGRCKACVCELARQKRLANPPPIRTSDVVPNFGTDTERAWAAGFFDGEGSVSVSTVPGRRGTLRAKGIKASCNQIHPDVLERFADAVGLGTVVGPYGGARKTPIYAFNAHGIERVELMYEALWPWLGTVKKEQALRKIDEYRAWREEWERLIPAGNRRIPLGPKRKTLRY